MQAKKSKIYIVKITEANPEFWYATQLGNEYKVTMGISYVTPEPIPVFVLPGDLKGCYVVPPLRCILPTDCIIISEQLISEP